jgi:uncharacterized protein
VTVQLPMSLHLIPANDDESLAAVAFGPTILSGNYGDSTLSGNPTLTLDSLSRVDGLDFTGTANGQTVDIGPFYNAHGFNYVVYWEVTGSLPNGT